MAAERRRTENGLKSVSPSDLSSPPRSSPERVSPSTSTQHPNNLNASENAAAGNNNNNDNNNSSGLAQVPAAIDQKPPPPRKKPGRKPGSTNKPKVNTDSSPATATATANVNTNAPAPKPRQKRKPKDPNAPPIVRKKSKKLDIQFANDIAPQTQTQSPHPDAPSSFKMPVLASQSGNHEDIQQRPIQSFFSAAPPQQHSPPQLSSRSQPASQSMQPQSLRTSGQNYDPIRSNYDPVRETVVSHNPYGNPQTSPSQAHSMNHASASPSISSLVDPPNHALASPSVATQSFYQQQLTRLHQTDGPPITVPASPTMNRMGPVAQVEFAYSPKPGPVALGSRKPENVPSAQYLPATTSKKMGTASTATSSTTASPKPHKAKEPKEPKEPKDPKETFPAPPPLPGSGLMGIGGGGPADGTEFRAPTVILSIPMNVEGHTYINFSRLAEEQYGWDALHPRLAAQRDRLARVAAASAALERSGSTKESGDEMSLDSDAEGEGSNVEMGGMSDGRTGTDPGKKVTRKRKSKEDEYDKDDGFVDDTELLWEEQAAATNDGFFVYSGPLVPEGEKPALDVRADGAPKRGRGRGSRGGRVSSRAAAALLVSGTIPVRPNGLPAHGPGSRGGATTRKPRITKADRARMEQEKLEREKMGSMASMPGGYGSMPHLASAPSNLGATPMVFN